MVNYDRIPAASQHFDGELYQKMNEDLQLAGMSKRTVHGYLRAVRQLADYCQKTPDNFDPPLAPTTLAYSPASSFPIPC
jgi:hypothetical protein